MKKITLFSVFLLLALGAFSQSKVLVEIPSPPGYDEESRGYFGSPIVLGTDLYLMYKGNDYNYDLVKYDGSTLTPIPSPAGFENSNVGYQGFPYAIGSNLALRYKGNDNNYDLFRYNGTSLTEVPSPTGFSGPFRGYNGDPIAIGSMLYLNYVADDLSRNLFSYNGSTLSIIPNPTGFENGSCGYYGQPIVLGTDLFLRYRGNDGNYDLFKFDGSTLTQIPSPPGFENSGDGYNGNPVVLGTTLFLQYVGNDGSFYLFKYDGTDLTQMPNPTGFDAPYCGYYGQPIVVGSDLYLRYRKNDYSHSLFKFDGNITEIANDGYYYDAPLGVSGSDLILNYKDNLGDDVVFIYDGNTFLEISTLPNHYYYPRYLNDFNGNLFLYGNLLTDSDVLFSFDGNDYTEIPSPSEYTGYYITQSDVVYDSTFYIGNRIPEAERNLLKLVDVNTIDSIIACDSLSWINGKTYYSSSVNTDAVVLSDINGNDSVVLLNLIIPDSTYNVSIDTYESSYDFAGSTYSTNGDYFGTLTSSIGCDSTVYLNLNFLQNPLLGAVPPSICLGDSITFSLSDSEVLSANGNSIGSTFIATTDLIGNNNIQLHNYTKTDEYFIDTSGQFSYIDISDTETFLFLGDDDISDFLPIGFEFDYWGQAVDKFNVVSNGWVSFDMDTYDYYNFGLPVYDEELDNSIVLIDSDLDPSSGGGISYSTVGTAPNRIFVVDFDSVSFYEDNDVRFSAQLQIYEADNRIEIHTEYSDNLSGSGAWATQGIQSPDQNIALTVPGRSESFWVATNDYVAFIPDSTISATISYPIEVIAHSIDTINLSGVDSLTWNGTTYTENFDTVITYPNANSNGCDSIIVVTITIEQEISVEDYNFTATVYPNPTESRVVLESSEMGRYRLVDIYGSQILNEEKTAYREEIDMSSLANGLYFVVFKGKNHQIIKQ